MTFYSVSMTLHAIQSQTIFVLDEKLPPTVLNTDRFSPSGELPRSIFKPRKQTKKSKGKDNGHGKPPKGKGKGKGGRGARLSPYDRGRQEDNAYDRGRRHEWRDWDDRESREWREWDDRDDRDWRKWSDWR